MAYWPKRIVRISETLSLVKILSFWWGRFKFLEFRLPRVLKRGIFLDCDEVWKWNWFFDGYTWTYLSAAPSNPEFGPVLSATASVAAVVASTEWATPTTWSAPSIQPSRLPGVHPAWRATRMAKMTTSTTETKTTKIPSWGPESSPIRPHMTIQTAPIASTNHAPVSASSLNTPRQGKRRQR